MIVIVTQPAIGWAKSHSVCYSIVSPKSGMAENESTRGRPAYGWMDRKDWYYSTPVT